MREVPRTAHARSVVMKVWTRKPTDTKWALVSRISTRRWGQQKLV